MYNLSGNSVVHNIISNMVRHQNSWNLVPAFCRTLKIWPKLPYFSTPTGTIQNCLWGSWRRQILDNLSMEFSVDCKSNWTFNPNWIQIAQSHFQSILIICLNLQSKTESLIGKSVLIPCDMEQQHHCTVRDHTGCSFISVINYIATLIKRGPSTSWYFC